MLTLFTAAVVLGFVFNAAPGAVFAETVRQGVRGGFRPAFAVQVGSLVGDALWAVLGLAGVGLLVQSAALRTPIGIAGVVYLLWLAWDAWRAANQEFTVQPDGRAPGKRRALRTGVVLSVTNPQNVAYWAALGSAMGAVGVHEPSATQYGVFFAGFMTSSVLWCFICAALVDRVFRSVGQHWARITYRACAIAFLALALSSLRDLVWGRQEPAVTAAPPALHGRP
ncbi:LysE family translocator [Schlegelella sp. S2-27]|uniref:LysE family translocator n=1 Tax=Caldimonas mangrovi TaxID=2944811 RepID=A0ABT0YN46_9BURK|nr:LysE family transporter [Caldimonas mangrovi]MCM5679682.1 LysE family translocator [Caldimonas mangrovi]